MGTVPNISNLLQHIDDVISKEFISAYQYFLKHLTLNTRIQKW